MKTRIATTIALGAVVVMAAVLATNAPAGPPAHRKAADKKKLLVVSWTTGFRHSSIGTAEKTLAEIGEKSGVYTVEYCRTADDVKKMLTPEWLDSNKIDAVFFANTTGAFGIPDLNKFVDWVKAGHGFLGAHSAGDTYHPSDAGGNTAYIDMVGCEFRTHGKQAEANCIVEDTKHPATVHLGSAYKVTDEIYHFKVNNRPTVHVLLALKVQPEDGVKSEAGVDGSGKPTDMLIAWCKNFGKGKVFYTALGHREDVWESEPYRQHILGAIRWATGLAKGGVTKSPETVLSTNVPQVNISDATLDRTVKMLHENYGIDIAIKDPGQKPYRDVNVSISNKPLSFVIERIAKSAGAFVLYDEDGNGYKCTIIPNLAGN